MDTKNTLAMSALFYSGRILVDPCPPVPPLPLLALAAAGFAVKSLLGSKKHPPEIGLPQVRKPSE